MLQFPDLFGPIIFLSMLRMETNCCELAKSRQHLMQSTEVPLLLPGESVLDFNQEVKKRALKNREILIAALVIKKHSQGVNFLSLPLFIIPVSHLQGLLCLSSLGNAINYH